MRTSRILIAGVALVATFALSSCGAPTETETEVETEESSTPTPEAVVWDGCPDGTVETLTAGFAAEGSTKVVALGTVADVTDPVVASLLPDTSCVLNFSYSDAANLWTVIVAPDDAGALSSAIDEAALAAGYTVDDYGFLSYLLTSSPGVVVGFDLTTASAGPDLSDPYGDVNGAELFPDYEGSLVAIRIEVA